MSDPDLDLRTGTVVIAPAPELTVTLEQLEEHAEIHLHPGGQGYWIARLVMELGVETTLCGSFGGETGRVVLHLIQGSGMPVVPVAVEAWNGGYVHDRRGGTRQEVGTQPPGLLARHDLDDLYSAALAAGLRGRVCVLGGPNPLAPPVPADFYERLSHDLRTNETVVVADLSGEPRDAVLAGGVTVLKTSDEDLAIDGVMAPDADDRAISDAMRDLARRSAGARHVVVTRGGDRPALALTDGELLSATGPSVDVIDPAGAGDSVTAGITAALSRGLALPDALRLGVAAATLNVTRHGLASGDRAAIDSMADQVRIEVLDGAGAR